MKNTKTPSSPAFFLPEVESALIQELYKGGSLSEIMAPLLKRIVESALKGEMASHLESESLEGIPNRRNGRQSKQIRSEYGPIEIETSRDRNGSFEPKLIGKQERQLQNGVEKYILDLYGMGMSYDSIRSHMKKMYGVELSDAQLTHVTNSVFEDLEKWRNRPLESLYTMVWVDGIRYKVREQGKVVSITVYLVIGVDLQGKRDILGFYTSETESAKYWLQVFENLKMRGVKDILIMSTDNLPGINTAIEAAFPDCLHQLCIVHQVRNSVKYLPYKDYRPFVADLKKVYQAVDEQEALNALSELEKKWGTKYPPAISNWRRDWEQIRVMFQFGSEIRRLIYTTNTIEGVNRQLRKVTKTKGAFTSVDALKKLIFMAIQNITEDWSQSIRSWNTIYLQLVIHFKHRLENHSMD
jgi:putative transposase